MLDDLDQALKLAKQAINEFRRLDQQLEEKAEIFLAYAECLLAKRDSVSAQENYALAQSAIQKIASKIQDPNQRDCFLQFNPIKQRLDSWRD